MLQTRKPMTDEAIQAMAARNEHRRQIAKRVLGDKYAHHPANHVPRANSDVVSIGQYLAHLMAAERKPFRRFFLA